MRDILRGLAAERRTRVDIDLSLSMEQVRVGVEDTGIGVRREDLHRSFIEFQQLDAGTYLGHAGVAGG